MPTTVVLTLDTAAPVVDFTFAEVWPGETFRASYVSDEPLAWAWLELPDGRRVDATILADRVEALVPYDATAGAGRLHVFDDVGNKVVFDVRIEGAVPPTEVPTPVGGWPQPRAGVAPRRHRYDTRLSVRTTYQQSQRGITSTSRVRLAWRYEIRREDPAPGPTPPRRRPSPPGPAPPPSPPPPQRLATTSRIRVTSTYKSQQSWRLMTTSGVTLKTRMEVRKDESGEVAFLVALGII